MTARTVHVRYDRGHAGITEYDTEGYTPERLAIVRLPELTYSQRRGQHQRKRNDVPTVHLPDGSEARGLTLVPGAHVVDRNDEWAHPRTACGTPARGARRYIDLDVDGGVSDHYRWCRKCFPGEQENR